MKKVALIIAGGTGTRMNHEVPKQFIELHGKPILMHTIEKFRRICDEIVLVLPVTQIDYWKKLCTIHHFSIPCILTEGGTERLQSVYKGLQNVSDDSLVAIHDGVRPLIEESLIKFSFEEAETHGNAVLSVKLKDSIRELAEGTSRSLNRENYVLIQTPQTFISKNIKVAFERLVNNNIDPSQFTDDASVAEFYGEKINLIEGSYRNIKITIPEDLKIAEVLVKAS